MRPIKAALSTVLSDVLDDGYLETNSAFSAGRKRGKRADALTQSERLQKIRPLSWTDRDALLAEAASDRRHYALFATLAKAGLRPGEGFALKPEDITSRTKPSASIAPRRTTVRSRTRRLTRCARWI